MEDIDEKIRNIAKQNMSVMEFLLRMKTIKDNLVVIVKDFDLSAKNKARLQSILTQFEDIRTEERNSEEATFYCP